MKCIGCKIFATAQTGFILTMRMLHKLSATEGYTEAYNVSPQITPFKTVFKLHVCTCNNKDNLIFLILSLQKKSIFAFGK